MKLQCFSSSSHSNIGKSITQAKASRSGGARFNRSRKSSRRAPNALLATSALPATMHARSPCLASRRRTISETSESFRSFAAVPFTPSAVHASVAIAFAPAAFTRSVIVSTSLREEPALEGATMARTAPPLAIGSANTRASLRRRVSVMSTIPMPNRRSGLSVPKRAMASA